MRERIRRLLVVEGKSFEISLEDGSKGRFLRIAERSKGISRFLFLEKNGAEGLARWIHGLQSQLVVEGLRANWEGKFRHITVYGKANMFGNFLRVVEVPYDRIPSSIIVPEGVKGVGWRSFASAVVDVLSMATNLSIGLSLVKREGFHDGRSYSRVTTVKKLPLDGGCVLRWRNGTPICIPDRDGIIGRRHFLKSCLTGRCQGGSLGLIELQKKVSRLWNVAVELVDMGNDYVLFQFPTERDAERVLAGCREDGEGARLKLERWSERGGFTNMAEGKNHKWVLVVGVPMHLRSWSLFKRIGEVSGGFIEVDPRNGGSGLMTRIRVKAGGRIPEFVLVEDGEWVYKIWVKEESLPERLAVNDRSLVFRGGGDANQRGVSRVSSNREQYENRQMAFDRRTWSDKSNLKRMGHESGGARPKYRWSRMGKDANSGSAQTFVNLESTQKDGYKWAAKEFGPSHLNWERPKPKVWAKKRLNRTLKAKSVSIGPSIQSMEGRSADSSESTLGPISEEAIPASPVKLDVSGPSTNKGKELMVYKPQNVCFNGFGSSLVPYCNFPARTAERKSSLLLNDLAIKGSKAEEGNGLGMKYDELLALMDIENFEREDLRYIEDSCSSVSEEGNELLGTESFGENQLALAVIEDDTPLAMFCGDVNFGKDETFQGDEDISEWVLKRVKGLSGYLGVSCRGYEEEALRLFHSIENRWRDKQAVKVVPNVEKRVSRELRRLECSVNYDSPASRVQDRPTTRKGEGACNPCI